MKKGARNYVVGYLLTLITSWSVWCIVNIMTYVEMSGSEFWCYFITDFAENVVEALFLHSFSIVSCRMLSRFLSHNQKKRLVLVVGLITHILVNACFSVGIAWLYTLLFHLGRNDFHHILLSDFFVLELLSTVYLALSLIRRGDMEEIRRMQAEADAKSNEILALQMKLDTLALQTNNHFVFNSFASAAGLIRRDPSAAEEFIRRMSSMYRYLTRCSGERMVSLEDELKFVDNYVHMLENRYSGICVRISSDLRSIQSYVPPVSVQLLIENAVKHNSHGIGRVLDIEVTLEGDTVVVTNNIMRRCDEVPGNHIGLLNLRRRYGLLTRKEMVVKNDGESFKVTLPLIFEEDLYYEGSDN